jgi:hypothetical protein
MRREGIGRAALVMIPGIVGDLGGFGMIAQTIEYDGRMDHFDGRIKALAQDAEKPGANEAQLSKLVEMVMGHGHLRPASTPTDDLKLEEEFRRSCVVDDPDGARAGASCPQPRQNTVASCS